MFLGVDRDKSGRIGFFGSSGGTSGFGVQIGTVPTRSGRLASMHLSFMHPVTSENQFHLGISQICSHFFFHRKCEFFKSNFFRKMYHFCRKFAKNVSQKMPFPKEKRMIFRKIYHFRRNWESRTLSASEYMYNASAGCFAGPAHQKVLLLEE